MDVLINSSTASLTLGLHFRQVRLEIELWVHWVGYYWDKRCQHSLCIERTPSVPGFEVATVFSVPQYDVFHICSNLDQWWTHFRLLVSSYLVA